MNVPKLPIYYHRLIITEIQLHIVFHNNNNNNNNNKKKKKKKKKNNKMFYMAQVGIGMIASM